MCFSGDLVSGCEVSSGRDLESDRFGFLEGLNQTNLSCVGVSFAASQPTMCTRKPSYSPAWSSLMCNLRPPHLPLLPPPTSITLGLRTLSIPQPLQVLRLPPPPTSSTPTPHPPPPPVTWPLLATAMQSSSL